VLSLRVWGALWQMYFLSRRARYPSLCHSPPHVCAAPTLDFVGRLEDLDAHVILMLQKYAHRGF
jgi:hypothetical protein